MARFSLIASVDELGLFGGLAATPRKLATAAAVATALALGYGLGVGGFVHQRSAAVGLNLALVTAQFFFVLGAAYVQAMWLGARLFGDAWRRRTFLGERPAADSVDIGAFKDRSMQFYGLFALSAVATYGAIMVVTDDWVGRYNRDGYPAALMRSADPELRAQALRGLVDPFNAAAADTRRSRDAIVRLTTEDEDAEVRAWAAWACGQLRLLECAPALTDRLERGTRSEKIEAAIALGRVADPDGEARMIRMLPVAADDPELGAALVTGLGLVPSLDAVEGLTALLGTVPEEVEVPILWALGRARTTAVRDAAWARWEAAESDTLACAAAELLKHATTVEDYERMRDLFDAPDPRTCEPVVFEGRQYSEEHALAPIEYVVGEELRTKYLKAAFNIGGPGLERWLVDVAWAEGESDALRVQADRLAEHLRQAPARLPRE